MADIFNMLDTWNASGTTFTGIKLNVTDTASAAGSLLMDLQVGGVSKANITKTGRFYSDIATNSAAAVSYALKTGVTTGFGGYFDSPALISSGDARLWANNTGVYVGTNIKLWLPTSTFISFNDDLTLYRDAANTLAQRNGPGQAQAFNLYNTYDNSLNYERGFMRWSSNVLQIGNDKLGTGSARELQFQTDGTTRLTIGSTGAATFTSSINSGSITTTSGGFFAFTGRTIIRSPADGQLRLSNNLETDFNRLQFGGTTSSFPALKRSTTSLQARLADDSAFTNIQGKLTTEANAVSETITATHTITLYDAAGTAYKVPCVAV